MTIRMHDLGELGYGGLVTVTEWYDDKRIEEGKITEKDILKKVSTYGYLVPGGICLLTSAFGWGRMLKPWDEHISHGFIYDFPRFIRKTMRSMRTEKSSVVSEAQRILRQRQLTQGREVSRSYQKEFESVAPHAF